MDHVTDLKQYHQLIKICHPKSNLPFLYKEMYAVRGQRLLPPPLHCWKLLAGPLKPILTFFLPSTVHPVRNTRVKAVNHDEFPILGMILKLSQLETKKNATWSFI